MLQTLVVNSIVEDVVDKSSPSGKRPFWFNEAREGFECFASGGAVVGLVMPWWMPGKMNFWTHTPSWKIHCLFHGKNT